MKLKVMVRSQAYGEARGVDLSCQSRSNLIVDRARQEVPVTLPAPREVLMTSSAPREVLVGASSVSEVLNAAVTSSGMVWSQQMNDVVRGGGQLEKVANFVQATTSPTPITAQVFPDSTMPKTLEGWHRDHPSSLEHASDICPTAESCSPRSVRFHPYSPNSTAKTADVGQRMQSFFPESRMPLVGDMVGESPTLSHQWLKRKPSWEEHREAELPIKEGHVVSAREPESRENQMNTVPSVLSSLTTITDSTLPSPSTSPTMKKHLESEEQLVHAVTSNGVPFLKIPFVNLMTDAGRDDVRLQPDTAEQLQCRWLNCSQCFQQLDDLVNHVNDAHVKVEKDVEYKCYWIGCPRNGRGFNARYKMLIHVRTHTNEKPHRCHLCGKSFSRLENLKIHNRSHTGEKPYLCPFEGCTKAYSNSSDRFKHVRTHQVDRPYCCKMPGCSKRYTDPSSLRKHIKTHGHYFRGLASNQGLSAQKSPNQVARSETKVSTGVQPELQAVTPEGTTCPTLYTLTPNGMIIQGKLTDLAALATKNPFLSSSLVVNPVSTQSISTQTENVINNCVTRLTESANKTMVMTSRVVNDSGKLQDTPLDLSTCPIALQQQTQNGNHIISLTPELAMQFEPMVIM